MGCSAAISQLTSIDVCHGVCLVTAPGQRRRVLVDVKGWFQANLTRPSAPLAQVDDTRKLGTLGPLTEWPTSSTVPLLRCLPPSSASDWPPANTCSSSNHLPQISQLAVLTFCRISGLGPHQHGFSGEDLTGTSSALTSFSSSLQSLRSHSLSCPYVMESEVSAIAPSKL